MIPIEQQIHDKDAGDCMRATVASLLELPIDAVPHFLRFDGNKWFPVLYYFFWAFGYEYEGVKNYSATGENDLLFEDSINGFFYGVVPSRNFDEKTHAVVMDMTGLVVHDPSPTKKWQDENIIESGECIYWYRFRRMEK